MPDLLEEILEFNKRFVADREYEKYDTSRLPDKKIAILTCMDTRLTELLPAALNIRNGDVKMIKNAGALISHPFGSVMRSLLLAVYDLGVEEVMVVGHHDCSMKGLEPEGILDRMRARGVEPERLEMLRYCGIDIRSWFRGFEDSYDSVRETVNSVRNHPLMPGDVRVRGFLMDPFTGLLESV